MKKTELKGVYCKPKTEEEWEQLGLKPIEEKPHVTYYDNGLMQYHIHGSLWMHISRTEITVSKFIDLLEDKITGWRLEEVGFKRMAFFYRLDINDNLSVDCEAGIGTTIMHRDSRSKIVKIHTTVETFTELLTLLKLLGNETLILQRED